MNYNKENADKIDEYLKNNPSACKLAADDPCVSDENITLKEKEMKILILTGLVVIIVLLAFIAVMIWGIGEHLSQK